MNPIQNNSQIENLDKELPRNQIFSSPWEQKFISWYRRFFSITEIEDNNVLHWVFGALLMTYFVSFSFYIQTHYITKEAFLSNSYQCWPYFQSCGEYYFLSNLPYGYTQPVLYIFFFGVMVLTIVLMWKKDWVLAHMTLGVLFLWKFILIFFLTSASSGNYDYYDIIFSIIFLALPHKIFFLKLAFVVLYFLAATIKIHEGWILGSYFTTLETGLPLFPDNLTPLFTNFVIFMQIIGAWFLLSSKRLFQRIALFYFLCFHFYSGTIVYYRYLISTIPILIILFGMFYKHSQVPRDKKSIVGWSFIVLLFSLQSISFTIAGDQKMTLEGNRFGLYMFEANHQCISQTVITLSDGSRTELKKESFSSRARCDPYKSWFKIKQLCDRHPNIENISWTFDHSINGNAFYRIVDVKNACGLEYKPFTHNDWIRLPSEEGEIMGFPVKNVYYY